MFSRWCDTQRHTLSHALKLACVLADYSVHAEQAAAGCVPCMHPSSVVCPCNYSSAHAPRSVLFLPMMQSKLRLDAYLAAKLPTASRARLQASIKEGLVVVNGRQQVRSSCLV